MPIITVLCVCAVIAVALIFLFSFFGTATKSLDDLYARREALKTSAEAPDGEGAAGASDLRDLLSRRDATTEHARV